MSLQTHTHVHTHAFVAIFCHLPSPWKVFEEASLTSFFCRPFFMLVVMCDIVMDFRFHLEIWSGGGGGGGGGVGEASPAPHLKPC